MRQLKSWHVYLIFDITCVPLNVIINSVMAYIICHLNIYVMSHVDNLNNAEIPASWQPLSVVLNVAPGGICHGIPF